MFKSFSDVAENFDVVKSACVLMEDASDFMEHICEKFVENAKACLRKRRWYGGVRVLSALAAKVKNVNPLCNEHFYFVTKLPLVRSSRMYQFEVESKCVTSRRSNMDDEYVPCVVCIERRNRQNLDVLKAISETGQTITDLFLDMCNMDCSSVLEIPGKIFKLDPGAKSVRLRHTNLAQKIQNDPGDQLVSCQEIELLEIPEKPYIAQKVLSNLHTKVHLEILVLAECGLSEAQCSSICEQLQHLPHLT